MVTNEVTVQFTEPAWDAAYHSAFTLKVSPDIAINMACQVLVEIVRANPGDRVEITFPDDTVRTMLIS